jgi:myo-inositol-1(or 4)-monophosphatase
VGFVGEEESQSTDGEFDRPTWILDPVDGTVNFVHGIPLTASALALADRGRVVLGVIDFPFLGSRYWATAGGGAYMDGARVRPLRRVRSISDAVVTVGDLAVGSAARERNAMRLAVIEEMAGVVLRIRMLGSASLDLAWLAAGRTDGMVTLSNKPWDMAAGTVIARESGIQVVDIDGHDYGFASRSILAAPPKLVEPLLDLIRRARLRIVSSAEGSGARA